jgi:hypothetical protein
VQGAPRGKILRLPTDGSVALVDAPVLVAEGDAVMEHLVATASHLYLEPVPWRLFLAELEICQHLDGRAAAMHTGSWWRRATRLENQTTV